MPDQDVHKFLDRLEADPDLRKEVREARDIAIDQICEIASKHGLSFSPDELRSALADRWDGIVTISKSDEDEDLPSLAILSEPPGL
jgi:hypothetical protein